MKEDQLLLLFAYTTTSDSSAAQLPGGPRSTHSKCRGDGRPGAIQDCIKVNCQCLLSLLRSYQAHHAARVATVAATDDRLQFELDTTEAEGRQVMLQGTAGAAAIKVEHITCIR